MKKIAVVAGYAPSLRGFRGPLLRAMIAAGHEVSAFAPDFTPELWAELEFWPVHCVTVPLARAGMNPLADWRSCRVLAAEFRRLQPDIILAYTHKPVVYSARAARQVPSAAFFGLITGLGYAFADTSSRSLKQRIVRAILCGMYRRVCDRWDGVIFQNPDDQRLFRDLGLVGAATPQTIVRGSGIDLADFPLAPEPAAQPPRFLMIARLLVDKGVREFASAARLVRAIRPDAEFHLVGPHDSNPAAIPADVVSGWVSEGLLRYHGSRSDIRGYLRDCCAYVLPSYREGTPRTVLEAMATGRAVITTDTPGCRETVFNPVFDPALKVLRGDNGFLVPVRDAAALSAAMLACLEAPALRAQMGATGRRLAEEHYDVLRVNAQLLAFMGLRPN